MVTAKIRNLSATYVKIKSVLLSLVILMSVATPVALSTAAMAMPIPAQTFAANATSLTPDPNDLACPSDKALSKTQTGNGAKCIIQHIIAPIVGGLVALTGVLVVISIIIAGIQYSSSAGDPNKLAAARKRIFNAVIALLSFMFLYVFINWVIPGGIQNGGSL